MSFVKHHYFLQFQVFKYEESFFKTLFYTAQSSMRRLAGGKSQTLNKWNTTIDSYHKKVSLSSFTRQEHNDEYQALVKSISDTGGYKEQRKNLGRYIITGIDSIIITKLLSYMIIQLKQQDTLNSSEKWVWVLDGTFWV